MAAERAFNRCASGHVMTAEPLPAEEVTRLCDTATSQLQLLTQLERAALLKRGQARQTVGYGREKSSKRSRRFGQLDNINSDVVTARSKLRAELRKLIGQEGVPASLAPLVRDAEHHMLKMQYLGTREEYLRAIAMEELSSSEASSRKQDWMRIAGVPGKYHFREVWHYVQEDRRRQTIHLFFGGEGNPVGRGHGHFKLVILPGGKVDVPVHRLPEEVSVK